MIEDSVFLIDSGFKKHNKGLYAQIAKLLKSQDIALKETTADETSEGVIIISRDAFEREQEYFKSDSNRIFLLFEGSQKGLQLFTSTSESESSDRIIVISSSEQLENALPFVLSYNSLIIQSHLNPLLKKCFIDLKEIGQGAKRFMEQVSYTKQNLELFSTLFHEIYEVVLSLMVDKKKQSIKEALSFFNKKISSAKFELVKNLSEYQDFDRLIKIVPREDFDYIIGMSLKKRVFKLEDYDCFVLGLFISIQELYNSSLKSFVFSDEKNEIISNVFDSIPVPCALFNSEGEILLYNSYFIDLQLSPTECLNFEGGSTVSINSEKYQCIRSSIVNGDDAFFLFSFINQTTHISETYNMESNSVLNPKELGIITSSIAHELNNPLAGILTAISYLKMEDNYSEEQLKALNEMELGAKRCKNLVEVFLGFSRAQNTEFDKRPIYDSYENALSLLNFRVVETNIKLALNWNVSDYFNEKHSVNTSIFSMIFYLIFGDLLTAFSHEHLVRGNSNSDEEPTLNGSIYDKYDALVIDIDRAVSNYLKDLDFVTFLLRLEGFYLEQRENSIRIIFKTEIK